MTIPRNLSNLAPGASSSGVLDVAHGGTGVTTSTGTGSVVLSTSPTLTTPDLGTPSAVTLTSATGLPLSTGVTGTLGVTNGGTGSSTAFTTGSVVFAGASGVYSQDNAQLFWDNTNNRLGIGTATPAEQLTITASTPTMSMNTPVDGNRVEQRFYNDGSQIWTAGINYSGGDGIYFIQRNFGLGNLALVPDGNGNVGIGTSTPTAPLEVNGNIKSAGTLVMGSSFLRNKIINGLMTFYQRSTGSAITPTTSVYTLDRWYAALNVASKYSVQQSATTPAGFQNSLLVTSTSAYSVAAGDSMSIQQKVEACNVYELAWGTSSAKTVTLSFWTQASASGTYGGNITFAGSTSRVYPFTYSIPSANTWTYITVTIPGDTAANTAAVGNAVYLTVAFGLGVGSSSTTGTTGWQNGNNLFPTGAVNLVATNGATWYVTGVQLEIGSIATPFEQRPFSQEVGLCYRYYYRATSSTNYTPFGTGLANNTTQFSAFFQLPPMRSTPASLDIAAAANFLVYDGVSNLSLSSFTLPYASATTAIVLCTGTGLTQARPGILQSNNTATAYIGFSAEL